MAYYEVVFVARQDFTPAQVVDVTKEFEGIITENKGKVAKTESWGLRQLAYKINKNKKGHYVLFQIEADAECIKEFDRKVRLNENIIRHMIVKIDELTKEPSAILTNKEDSKYDRR